LLTFLLTVLIIYRTANLPLSFADFPMNGTGFITVVNGAG
jgi:hypothetical protein